MSTAAVGDDDYGEDPTVNRLEGLAASKLGKEAAIFLPTGTMANLLAILTHTHHGDEAIVEEAAHIYLDEAGGMSAVAGVIPRPVAGTRGAITGEQLRAALRPEDRHFAPTRLLCLENSHNAAGGLVVTPQATADVCAVAHERGLFVHLDGARIFNAAIALNVDVRSLVRDTDSMMFCISKGLSAPVGSLLLGTSSFIARARRRRKQIGGGMRQAGVIAAAGIVALETMIDRLAEDHRQARTLAHQLAKVPGLRIDTASVQTNIVMIDVDDAPWVVQQLALKGVLADAQSLTRIRLVTHRHIGTSEVEEAVNAFGDVMKDGPNRR